MCFSSDAAPRLLQENQKYLSQLTSLMQEAADDQAKSIVVSSLVSTSTQFSGKSCVVSNDSGLSRKDFFFFNQETKFIS